MIPPPNLHALNSTLLALPVAAAFTRRLLQNHKSPALAAANLPGEKIKINSHRGGSLAERLKNIVGYSHHGLNE